MFQALRKYFIMDIGLSLYIIEKDVNWDCSTVGFISPAEHHSDLSQIIEKFNVADTAFLRRVNGAKFIVYCSPFKIEKCEDGILFENINLPSNILTFKPL